MRDGWVWYDGSLVWAGHCVYCGNVPEYDRIVEDAMDAVERWVAAKDAVVAAAMAGDDVTEEMRERVRQAEVNIARRCASPNDIVRWCALWCVGPASRHREHRRVVCVEPDGERRTWLLYEGGRQCGHVRARWWQDTDVDSRTISEGWTWEAAGAGRDILGLPAYNAAEESPGR